MPFRARFDCLWCGTAWETRGPDDLEGWALLCPACLGKAGSNPFLRGRLRTAIAQRGAAATGRRQAAARDDAHPALPARPADPAPTAPPARPAASPVRRPLDRQSQPPAFPDDWFLRRGPFERGPVHDAAWQAELDVVTRWLDGLPLAGRIDEPAAGVGFFSPLLASKGELHASDLDGDALDHARERLLAHRLLAHLHVADPWARPVAGGASAAADGASGRAGGVLADAVVAAFLLGRVRGAGLDPAAAALRARLRPGGLLAVVDLRPDPAGGPPDGIAWSWHEPALIEAALARAGFARIEVRSTGRFFLLASAQAT